MAIKQNKEPTGEVLEIKFSKSQLVESKRFSGQKDLLNTVLDDEKEYTLDEVVSKVENYLKGKVK